MLMTNRLVIANWKMNGDLAFAKALVSSLPSTSNVQTVLVPPATCASLGRAVRGT